jgi:hypothetical protein
MKSSRRSPDGGSSVAPNTKIEPSEAVLCAWWGTASTPIRSFHTVSEGEFSEVQGSKRIIGRRGPHSRAAWWHPLGIETRRLSSIRCTVIYQEVATRNSATT